MSLFNFGQKSEPESRGVLSSVGQRLFGERDGTSFSDRMMMAGMALQGDPRGAVAYRQGLQEQQLAEQRRIEQQKQEEQERQRLYAQADAANIPRNEFVMLPEAVRNERLMRQYNPAQPDLPSSFEEFQLAQNNPAYAAHLSSNPRGTNLTVNMPDGRQGTRVGDMMYLPPDAQNPQGQFVPIPGGQQDRSDQGVQETTERYGSVVLDNVDRIESLILDPDNDFITGRAGQALAIVNPQSRAGDMQSFLQTIKANVGFNRLAEMRQNSPTGGAVGQLSDPERRALEATLGSLEQARSNESLLISMANVRNAYNDAIYGTPDQIRRAVQSGQLGQEALQYAERVDPDQYASIILTRRSIAGGAVPAGARRMVGPNGEVGYAVDGVIYDERGRVIGRAP